MPKSLHRIAVVIPTLNEEATLPSLIQDCKNQTESAWEIWITDAGSTDQTLHIAQSHHLNTINSPRGRGCQIASAIEHIDADVIFIAHADMRIETDTFSRILSALNETQQPGGVVGCTFSDAGLSFRIINTLNTFRARFLGISFGDQGQFFRRDILDNIEGFPAYPLMEDVEFSLRLKKVGRPLYLNGGITASSRQWHHGSKLKRAITIIHLVGAYLWQRTFRPDRLDLQKFYDRYYN